MYTLRFLLFFPFLLCIRPDAVAQQYRAFARRYGLEEGLPHRQVNKIIQDRNGFIWAATNAGVARFDGRHFKVFNKTESGLSGDLVEWVAEDAAGNIWACRNGTNPMLDIINSVSGTVTPSSLFFKDNPLPVPFSRLGAEHLIFEDSTLVISLHQPGGWLTYHPARGWNVVNLPEYRQFFLAKLTSRYSIWGICVGDDSNKNWLVELDKQGNLIRRYEPAPNNRFALKKGGTPAPDAFFVLEANPSEQNTIWEIKPDGTRIPAKSYQDYTFTPQYARVSEAQLTVQFPGIFEPSGKCLLDLSRQFPELDHMQFGDYLMDKNGNIWFGTAFGLVVVELRQDYFQRLLYDENAPGGRGYACRGLLEKNGQLTVNVETNRKGRFKVDTKTGTAERIPGDYAIGIAESYDGDIWTELGRPDSGWFYIYLAKTAPDGRVIGPTLAQKKMNGGSVWAIFEETPDRVLLGHGIGLTVYNPRTGRAVPWTDPAFPEFDGAAISCIRRSRSGDLYVCTAQGFFRLRPGGGVLNRYWSGGKGDAYLPYDNIYHFYEDEDGIFWLGTNGGGLIRWDRKAPPGKQTQVIFRKNGLLNGTVYAAYEDDHAHLWLPTDYGIVQFDKKTLQVRHTWLTADGVTHNEFNRVSHCRGADGRLYFGGLNGVTAFHPDQFYANNTTGPGKQLVISNFSMLDERSGRLENHTAALLKTNQILMYPGDRYFQLEFALLDYVSPERVTYTWKLEGVSADWESIREPELRLSSLPYGTHRLRIRAQAADGTWAANELDIGLTVLPPVFLRWWFLLLTALLLAAGIRGWVYWRTREHRREQERLETEVSRQTATIRHQTEELTKLDQAKSRFFANISHELRTPLTLLLGPLSSMLKGKRLESRDFTYAKTAHEHGKQLLQLVNEILDLSKMESGKMKLQETAVSLQPFLRRVVSAFESHAERLGILFVFEYQLPERLRVLVDEDKLQKVLNNLLSNALKFTPPHAGGAVRVTVSGSDSFIRIGVHDTGRGIHPDDLPYVFERFYQTSQDGAPIEGGTGIGLALCREFSDLMHGHIRVESTPGQGSSFYFEFPKKEVLGAGIADYGIRNAEYGLQDSEQIMANTGPDDPGYMGQEITDEIRTTGLSAVPSGKYRETILLVEDNDSLRDYVNSILSDKYHVIAATNGQEALDLLIVGGTAGDGGQKTRDISQAVDGRPPSTVHRLPDLIISDIMMPVMDGFQLLEKLKGDDRWRHIPVVMLTARADMRDKLRALRTGVDDYLLKPFEEDELLARVENLLLNYDRRWTVDGGRWTVDGGRWTVDGGRWTVDGRRWTVDGGRWTVDGGRGLPFRPPSTAHHPPSTVHRPPITAEEQTWLEDFEKLVEKRLGDFNLTAETLADALAMSRASFFRQLKRLTGLTPAQYLDEARFQKARRLLEHREISSVKAAAYSVGFRQVKHFSQNYKKRFGKLPSEHVG